jgi:hypothetical protein
VRNRRFVLITLTVVVLLLAGSGLAVASSDVPVAAAEEELDTTYGDLIGWLDELPPLVWWFLPKEGDTEEEPAPDCTGATGSGTDETTPSVTEEEADPCHVVTFDEGRQLTHGAVVSAFVHSLKDVLAKADVHYDGPQGQLVRDIARSNLGKDLADLDGSGDDGGVELEAAGEAEEDEDRSGPPDHARGQGHGKKDKPNKKPKK